MNIFWILDPDLHNNRCGSATLDFSQIFSSKSLAYSEQMSDKRFAIKKNKRFAHSLIYHEPPEQFVHSSSFVMSDLSDLLTVAHLS